jgi:hypothetical protein
LINFQYARANDVADAVRMIATDPTAKFIAGGTNLIDLMKEDVERPSRLIDIIAEYHVPVNADVHDIKVIFVDEPDEIVNRLGIKGLGEIGIVGVAAAIAKAVHHAIGNVCVIFQSPWISCLSRFRCCRAKSICEQSLDAYPVQSLHAITRT